MSNATTVIITKEKWAELSETLSVKMLTTPKDPVVQAMSRILNGVRNTNCDAVIIQ